MSDLFKLKNPLFTAADLYRMVRLSMIKYFPYENSGIGAAEVLTIFINKELIKNFKVEDIESERGLTFSGDSWKRFGNLTIEETGSVHSAAWYVTQVSKWHRETLGHLESDLSAMRHWLRLNGYTLNGLPTDKFLQQEFFVIADAAEERRIADKKRF